MEEEIEETDVFPMNISEVLKLIQEKLTNFPYKFSFDDPEDNVDQDFYLRFNCIQGWFIRCSFKMKVDFLKKCAMAVNDINLIITIINSMYTVISKDRLYSLATSIQQAADMKLFPEDNRCLDLTTLYKVMNSQINWFKALSSTKQYFFLIKLITLADGLVVMSNIYANFIEVLINHAKRTKSSVSLRRRTKSSRTCAITPQRTRRNESLKEEIASLYHRIIPLKSGKNDDTISPQELQQLLNKWKQFLNKYNESSFASEQGESEEELVSPSRARLDEHFDIIQTHPIWVPLGVLSNLETNAPMSKVNEYWFLNVKEYKTELGARKIIDKDIAALEEQIKTIKYNKKVAPAPEELRNRISYITKPSLRKKFRTRKLTHNSLICDVYKDYLVDFNLYSKKLQTFPRAIHTNKSKACNI